jgi:hypothetical protein
MMTSSMSAAIGRAGLKSRASSAAAAKVGSARRNIGFIDDRYSQRAWRHHSIT